MTNYLIKIKRPGNTAPSSRVIRCHRLVDAEFYAVEHLILEGKQLSFEDHGKIGHVPLLRMIERNENRDISRFEFNSRMFERPNRLPIMIEIQKDQQKRRASHYYDVDDNESIFESWPLAKHLEQETRRAADFPIFFNSYDLRYFASIAGQKMTALSPEYLDAADRLTNKNGVLGKLAHWARLMSEFNYTTEFRYDWQFKRTIRTYTWARVFPGKKSSKVFFTIGVGTRDVEGKRIAVVEFKLDRKYDLPETDAVIFDTYMSENAIENNIQTITADELSDLNWDALAERTHQFIVKHDRHFWNLRRLLDHNNKSETVFSRVCWNTNNWTHPSGKLGKSSIAGHAHEKDRGYGYEEWLFNTTKQIDGYHYAFLQSFNKGDHHRKVYNVRLYAFFNDGDEVVQYWVGHIDNVEVLSPIESLQVLEIYKARGWYDEMVHDLQCVDIQDFDFTDVKEDEIFNIRFKVNSDTTICYDDPIPIMKDEAIKNMHYTVTYPDSQLPQIARDPFEGCEIEEPESNETRKAKIALSFVGREREMRFLHLEMQSAIRKQLMIQYKGTGTRVQKEFPTERNTLIDILVEFPDGSRTLYEIKTASTALGCVREALGQLFEYCFYPDQHFANALIIIGPHPIDEGVCKYLLHLRSKFGIQLCYQGFDLNTRLLHPLEL